MGHERICGKGGPGRGDSRAKPLGAGERAWGALGEHGSRCGWKSVTPRGGRVSEGRRGEVRGQQRQVVILKVWLLRGDVQPRDGFEQRSETL